MFDKHNFYEAQYLGARYFIKRQFRNNKKNGGLMRLQFLNRQKEIERIERAIRSESAELVIVYGRRRLGKTRLLRQVVNQNDVYFMADRSERTLQLQALGVEIGRLVPSFDQVEYPTWQALFSTLNSRVEKHLCLVLDEFPYLVQSSPELPSVIQKVVDSPDNRISLVICGSSQRMMQGFVLDSSAPLYGRAIEIIKIRPLKAPWAAEALELRGISVVEAYSVWGGVPRYWELANRFPDLETAIKGLVFDQDGILHNEPFGLLLDDMRGVRQSHSLLFLIANGHHRLSKISSRLGKNASGLTRPLANLIDLGYIKRELPFGESLKSTKRTLYKLNDPFLTFWYRFVQKNRSLLEQDLIDEVYAEFEKAFPLHIGDVWEELARDSVSALRVADVTWKPAQRWWGKGKDGREMEIDIVAESFDGRHLLLGEAKWEQSSDLNVIKRKLKQNAENLTLTKGKKLTFAYWLRNVDKSSFPDSLVYLPDDVIVPPDDGKRLLERRSKYKHLNGIKADE